MHLISAAVIYSVAIALGLSVCFLACLALTQPITLITVLPISIAGWGIREAGLISVLSFAGVTNNDALVVSIVFGILLIIITLPGGIFLLFKNKPLNNRGGETS